jgi:tetratricopeptide (TPR) repeat protein
MRYKNTALSQIGHEWLVLGEYQNALNLFYISLEVTGKLVVSENNAIWQRDFSISLERIGDVLAAEGKWSEALAYYQYSHTIRLPLAKQNPENSACQNDLYWTYQDLGNVEMAQNEIETALADYNDSLAIAERLASADHTNKEWQSNLAMIREKEGEAMSRLGRLDEAKQNYQESSNIARRLTASDPINYEWLSVLATAEVQIAETLAAQGNLAGALDKYRDSLNICEKLVKKNPKNVLGAVSEGLACSGLAMLRSRTGDERQSEIRSTLIHAEDIFLGLQHRSALDSRCQNRLQEVQSILASF